MYQLSGTKSHLLVMYVLRDYLTSQNSACVLGAGQIALIAGSAAKLLSARQPPTPHQTCSAYS